MQTVFRISAPNNSAYITIAAIIVVVLTVAILFLLIAVSIRNVKVVVSDEYVWFKSLFYGRRIPNTELQRAGIRVVDLSVERELVPSIRANGIGLPGFWGGWFRLKNGEKALLFVTDRESVTYIPTAEYSIMVSAADSHGLAGMLRSGSAAR